MRRSSFVVPASVRSGSYGLTRRLAVVLLKRLMMSFDVVDWLPLCVNTTDIAMRII